MTARDKVETILKHVAESESILNYDVKPDEDVLRGDGLLSEFYTGEVRNKDTDELIQTYIKLPPIYNKSFISIVYVNEYNFYSNIYPALDKFQKEKGVRIPFDKIPKFYCGNIEPEKQYLVFENLRVQNYVMCDKTKFIAENHLKTILEIYGKFHALSFAFKDQNREEHEELMKRTKDVFPMIVKTEMILFSLKHILEMAYKIIKETDEEKASKIKPLLDNVEETCNRGTVYDGKYSALVHGDCWSNNIMLKFDDDEEIEDLRIIDFQLMRNSTPIHDLSYFLYCGASKEDLDKLDEYLELYHKSFSSFVRELGSEPEKLLPLEALKNEWKKYGFLGIIMSLFDWQLKLTAKEKFEELGDNAQPGEGFRKNLQKVWSSDTFQKIVCHILLHAIEFDML